MREQKTDQHNRGQGQISSTFYALIQARLTRWHKFLLLLCLLVATLLGSCRSGESPTPDSTATLPSLSGIVDEVMPSVVYVLAERTGSIPGQLVATSGSGVILQSEGYILTNRHVVEDAQRVEVTLQDRRILEAESIWIDDLSDLAVVKVEAQDLRAAQFGDPDTLSVGDWVIAIGHPLGLSPDEGGATVTVGIVSNLGRSFVIGGLAYYDIVQTDAAINPGSSGGPLVNLEGEVIGINSAVAGQAQNIGYAISVGTARRVFDDLVEYGRVVRPYLGVSLTDVTPAIACELCLAKRIGAVIVDLQPNGPADKAGLQLNDVIVSLDEEDITSATHLVRELWERSVGESLRVVFWRGDMEMETVVTLEERSS